MLAYLKINNFSPNWLVSGDKIIYSKTKAQTDIFVFFPKKLYLEKELKIEKYNNRLLAPYSR